MLKKQTSVGSSDSDDNYSFGSGRRLHHQNSAPSTSSRGNIQSENSRIDDGPMILKPSNPEYSDILLQEIARLSEQQRREAHSNTPSTSQQQFLPFSSSSTSNLDPNLRQLTATSSTDTSTTTNTTINQQQQIDLNNIANQYTNSVLPLRLPNNNPTTSGESQTTMMQNLTDAALSRANLRQTGLSNSNGQEFHTNNDFSYPMMLQSDSHSSCLAEFPVGAQKIVGFTVGGEPRLCLPQFKALVIPGHNGVDKLLSDLQIATVNASNDQLRQLIQANAIPKTIGYCPLITRSNAERLINYCIIKGIRPLYGAGNVDNFMDVGVRMALQNEAIHVEHFCFGGQSGIYYPPLLSGACIECTACQRLFEPPEFVRHSHASIDENEGKVCDWGFDSLNWKFYINLDESHNQTDETEERLRQLLSFSYDPTSILSVNSLLPSNLSTQQNIQSTINTSASSSGLSQQPVQS